MVTLAVEQTEDTWEVDALFDTCFAPGRELLSSYRLRDGRQPVSELCLIGRESDGALAAAVRHWSVWVGGAPTLLLGPIAVHPTHQGEGLGGLLIEESAGHAADLGWDRLLLVGDLAYYRRFGFARLMHVEMPPPTNPERVLGRELSEGSWGGISGTVTARPLKDQRA
ncbi:MAG: N-acetyltransferase [Pseudomonadota bacterium]